MSADNCAGDVSVPLRNVLNSIQCIRDRVKDGEPRELRGESHLSSFWNTLILAAKAVSQEATKLSLAFSKPPLPSQQDGDKLAEETLKSVLTFSTLYYWLPKSQGLTLRREIRDATVQVLEGVMQLVETILSSPLQSLSQEQLTSTGGVWSACDRFPQLSQDNKAAVLVALSSQIGIVKDALEEIEQALSEVQDPFDAVLDDDPDNDNPRGNQDTYWSEKDRQVMAPCQGLMKVSTVCIRKLSAAIKANGDVGTLQNVDQLDDLADITREISPGVDDLALCLYPPMDYTEVTNNVSKLAAILKKVLEIARSSHVCGESELTWIQFLDGAVDHNLQKAKDLIQQNG